jgi:hypothetical protein
MEVYSSRAQCYKTFYGRNLQIFVPAVPFHPSLLFVGEYNLVKMLPLGRVGLTLKRRGRLERRARDKRSSLLQTFLNYGHKIYL